MVIPRPFFSIIVLFFLALTGAAGCGSLGKDEIGGREMDQTVNDVNFRIKESRTLSSLAKLESSISDYYKAENKIPSKIESLIPKYLGEVPTVEISVRGHKDTSDIKYYSSDILRDGQVDGTKIKDTGKWGYVFNERQVIIFVDCTHTTSRGAPWYQERGVY